MSDETETGTDIVATEVVEATPTDNIYKGYRHDIVRLFQKHTNDAASALELAERFENGVMGALHLMAPSASKMRVGFAAAAQRFLEDPDHG